MERGCGDGRLETTARSLLFFAPKLMTQQFCSVFNVLPQVFLIALVNVLQQHSSPALTVSTQEEKHSKVLKHEQRSTHFSQHSF